MMLFTVKRYIGFAGLGLLLSGCAGWTGSACYIEASPRPDWVDRTAFALNLPDRYYYGKGMALDRADAVAESYADLARVVSVQIFSREIVQQTDETTRAEAVVKAISDVQAEGIEVIYEWRDARDCSFHMMARVEKGVAAGWKRRAQSYLVYRPGLGMVRRPAWEVHAIRYEEIGRPLVLVQWDPSRDVLERVIRGGGLIADASLRQQMKKSSIRLTDRRGEAVLLMNVKLAASAADEIVAAASLIDIKKDEVLASDVRTGTEIKGVVEELATGLLNDWLVPPMRR